MKPLNVITYNVIRLVKSQISINGLLCINRKLLNVISIFFIFFYFFFVVVVGLWSQLAKSLQFIQYHVAGFYKLTIPQSPPSSLRDYRTCNNARLEFSTIFVPSFDPNEWCRKNGLHSGGLNPGPLGHESSTLTTRPRLLALLSIGYRLLVPK